MEGEKHDDEPNHTAALRPRLSAGPFARFRELGDLLLDHIPNNAVNWVTQRNYGFSDAADLFVFISGYTASFVYARIMLERGFIIGGIRLIRRAWQIYVAHIVLLVMYIAEIGYLAHRYVDPNQKMSSTSLVSWPTL